MSKRPLFGSQFEKLRELGAKKPSDERKVPVETHVQVDAPTGAKDSSSSLLEQSLSNTNTVQSEQCSTQTENVPTVSANDSIQNGQGSNQIESEPTTRSGADTVSNALCEKRTVSKIDTVQRGSTEASVEPFTKVPHLLLRGEQRFSEPLDFMVYLHLYTYSYGFGRKEADMSQAQLERFTGAAKNTIKRSLERLTTQGWIKCVQEFECARMSRRWRITPPEDRSGKPRLKKKRTVSDADPVRNEQSSERTGCPSAMDTLTVSKIDTYKERDPKEKSKNSLSVQNAELREYFEALKPAAKRESEWRAYLGLRQDFSEEQIAACWERLQDQGLPTTGETRHSPMVFLGQAISRVWSEVLAEQEKRTRIEATARQRQEHLRQARADELAAEQDSANREEAFLAAYPDAATQSEILSEYVARFPLLGRDGPVARKLAIGAWWDERHKHSLTA